jgi:hypothetical protein
MQLSLKSKKSSKVNVTLLQEYNKLLGEKVTSQDWTYNLQDCLLGLLKSPVTILKQPCEKDIQRNGDIVVGFYLDPAAPQSLTLDLTIGGTDMNKISIQPGEFKYFFESTYFPIIAIQYTMTRVHTTDYTNLSIIYGYARTCIRRHMATKIHQYIINSKPVTIMRGQFSLNSEKK